MKGIFKTKPNKTKHEHLGGETFRVHNIIMHCINYSKVFRIRKKERCYGLRDADAECRRIIVNVRCCKLDNGKKSGLKFQEYYNVSIYHDQTNQLKMGLKCKIHE